MQPELFSALSTAWTILSGIVAGVAAFLAWNARQAVKDARTTEAAAKVAPLEQKVEELRGRLRALEDKVHAQPTTEMVHAIQLTIAEVKGQLMVIGSEVKSIAASAAASTEATNRLEEFFIARGLKS